MSTCWRLPETSTQRRLREIEAELERIKQKMSKETDEIAEIKTDVLNYKSSVETKITALEAQIAAGDNPDLDLALDDLKATVAGLAIPA